MATYALVNTEVPGPESRRIWNKEKAHIASGLAECTTLCPVIFREGKGSILTDVDGNRYIDLAAGVLTNSCGHCHPTIASRLKTQIDSLWHIHDFPNQERWRLNEKLNEKTPSGIDTFEYYTGGTETIEAAMRAAISYTGRYEFISFHGGYHGKTLGSRSLTRWWWNGFGPAVSGIRMPFAYCYRCSFKAEYPSCGVLCADYIEEAVRNNSTGSVAAVVFEPILGAGGVVIPPEEFLRKIVDYCRRRDILIIADEVLTGVGRTGKFFAIEHFDIQPDLMAFGKGLGSGFPVMALAGKAEIMNASPFGEPGGASTSFGGNPLGTAAALATVETIDAEHVVEHVRRMSAIVETRLAAMREKHPLIGDVRGIGLLWGMEFVKDRATKEPATEEGREVFLEAMRHGVKTLTPGALCRISPPLNIPEDVLQEGLEVFDRCIERVERRFHYL